MADTAIFSSLTISLPSVIVTLHQEKKEALVCVCVCVCVWKKLDDDRIYYRRKKPSIILSQSASPGNVNNPEWSLHSGCSYYYINVNEDLNGVQNTENCGKNMNTSVDVKHCSKGFFQHKTNTKPQRKKPPFDFLSCCWHHHTLFSKTQD